MPRLSAGLLLFRRRNGRLEVFLVHPGGPYWAHRDGHAWSLPKGECEPGEDLLATARREVAEETGVEPPDGPYLALGNARQPSGKVVHAWAVEGDLDETRLHSNTVAIEWPPRSGRTLEVPEVDRGGWFDLATAREKIHRGQVPFLDTLERLLGEARPPARSRPR